MSLGIKRYLLKRYLPKKNPTFNYSMFKLSKTVSLKAVSRYECSLLTYFLKLHCIMCVFICFGGGVLAINIRKYKH